MGLIASIYKDSGQDWSNGGISSRANEVTIVNIDGPFEPTKDRPAVLLVPGNLPNTVKVVPAIQTIGDAWVEDHPSGSVGPMMGGCYVATSDGRFSKAVKDMTHSVMWAGGAVPLHDRFETPAQYNMLSR